MCFWLAVCLVLSPGVALSQSVGSRIENLRVGFVQPGQAADEFSPEQPPRNLFKIATWTPVSGEIVGTAGDRVTPVVRVADPDGRAVLTPFSEITIPAGGRAEFRGQFRSGRIDAPLRLQLESPDGDVLSSHSVPVNAVGGEVRALRQTGQLWLALGRHRLFSTAIRRWNRGTADDVALVAEENPARADWTLLDLDGVDVIFLRNFTGVSSDFSNTLRDWVSRGGHLVLSLGPETDDLRSSSLANWLPALPAGEMDVGSLKSLTEAVGTPEPLYLTNQNRLVGAQLARGVNARPLVTSLTGPLLIRTSLGRGRITQLAISLDEDVLVDWGDQSQAELLALLTDFPAPWQRSSTLSRRNNLEGTLNPIGVTDLQTQLLYAVDYFPDIPWLSHWQIMGWIALFAVVIGPVDYFLVHRLLKRPAATWVTLMLWTGLAGVLVAGEVGRLNRAPAASRQLDLIDLDIEQNQAHVTTWRSFFAPQRGRIALSASAASGWLADNSPAEWLRLTWPTKPEAGFRGVYLSGGVDESRPAWQLDTAPPAIPDYPLAARSTGTVQVEWQSPRFAGDWAITELTAGGENRLSGTINHSLPGDLTDWFVAYGNFIYAPSESDSAAATLAPGTTVRIESLTFKILTNWLRNVREFTTTDQGKERAAREREEYNPLSRDPRQALQQLTFFRTAGAAEYTGLSNQTLRRLDLSGAVELNHAVLFGKLQSPATNITSPERTDANVQHDVYVRLLLPVGRSP